ncbi:signaling lymphocytic activation molecule-like [Carcharodon carcharias]|uniref:signaling lymphocytic activation molecule-like n=1 Tax=Carcharodon carcharias TaxID=13397 RepID=UPI001B7DBD07|nr:signaling lymphocytic activation molecule-like [Carcharodon carcharias]
MGISHGSKLYEVEWKRISSKHRIVRWTNGIIKYFHTEEYKKRFKVHPEDLSLQISELQREDTGVYEVSVVLDSGKESSQTVQLDVYESVTGTNITIDQNRRNCNMTLTCSVNTGDHISFRWWRGGEALRNDSTHHLSKTGEELQLYFTGEPKDSVYRCEARNPVSEDTAQITLRDVCNITVNASPSYSSPCPMKLTISVIILTSLLFVIVIVHVISRSSKGTDLGGKRARGQIREELRGGHSGAAGGGTQGPVSEVDG